MLGTPRVKAIRGFSDFGFSYVYVIFQDGTDLYWARSRTLEYLSKIQPRLPEGVRTELGPDATAVGWVYEYALVDQSGRNNLAQLRSFQDWYLRYWLQSVPGVAEVASIGGFQKQYQVNLDPVALLAYDIPISKVVEAIRDGQQRRGRTAGGVVRRGVHGARARLRQIGEGHRGDRRRRVAGRHADPGEEPRPRGARAGHPPRRGRPRRPGRHGRRHRGHAPAARTP